MVTMVLTPAKRRLDDGAVGRRRRRRVRGAKDQGPARSNVPRSSAYAAAAAAADLFGVWNSLLRSSSAVMSGALRRLGVLFIKQFTFYCEKSVAK